MFDTGHAPEAVSELAELAAYLDRPAAIEPVGLDVLRLNLRLVAVEALLVAEQRRGQARVGQLQGQLADAAMAMDLLAELSLAVDERDVIERMLEVFTALFAPGLLFYLPIDTVGGAGEPMVALGGITRPRWGHPSHRLRQRLGAQRQHRLRPRLQAASRARLCHHRHLRHRGTAGPGAAAAIPEPRPASSAALHPCAGACRSRRPTQRQ